LRDAPHSADKHSENNPPEPSVNSGHPPVTAPRPVKDRLGTRENSGAASQTHRSTYAQMAAMSSPAVWSPNEIRMIPAEASLTLHLHAWKALEPLILTAHVRFIREARHHLPRSELSQLCLQREYIMTL
jgi:hypothetical protein